MELDLHSDVGILLPKKATPLLCFAAYTGNGVCGGEFVPTYDKLLIADQTYCKASADLPYRTAILRYNSWVGDADTPCIMSITWGIMAISSALCLPPTS